MSIFSRKFQYLILPLLGQLVTISILLTSSGSYGYCQAIKMPASIKTLPKAKCYWGYGVRRLKTIGDSTHLYHIYLGCYQYDSTGKPAGQIQLKGAEFTCKYEDTGGKTKMSRFKLEDGYWTTNFQVHTNQQLKATILTQFNGQTSQMEFWLNMGQYPGEADNTGTEEL